jgi:hypothetical protein
MPEKKTRTTAPPAALTVIVDQSSSSTAAVGEVGKLCTCVGISDVGGWVGCGGGGERGDYLAAPGLTSGTTPPFARTAARNVFHLVWRTFSYCTTTPPQPPRPKESSTNNTQKHKQTQTKQYTGPHTQTCQPHHRLVSFQLLSCSLSFFLSFFLSLSFSLSLSLSLCLCNVIPSPTS